MTIIAIDFGTTNTVVSCLDSGEETTKTLNLTEISRQCTSQNGEVNVVPSVVFIRDSETKLVGEAVRKQNLGKDAPERLFHGFKKDLAAEYRPPAREIEGETYTTEAIAEFFLLQIWQKVLAQNITPSQVILTAPIATFPRYLNWLQNLGEQLNLPTQIIDEATAAAYGYKVTNPGSIVLVVDFGATSLDLSLVNIVAASPGQKVLKSELLAHTEAFLGGVDIDRAIAENHLQKIGSSRTSTRQNDWQNLLIAAEQIKIQLATNPEAKIDEIELNQREFAAILHSNSILPQIENAIAEILASALGKGISQEQINQVLLVGGSCQIPPIQQLFINKFGQEKIKADLSLVAVVKGALELGKIIGTKNYLQHSYAIRLWNPETENYFYQTLLAKGTSYPTEKPQTITLQAAQNNQREIRLEIGELRNVAAVEVTYNSQGQITSNELPQQTEFNLLSKETNQACVIDLNPNAQTGIDRLKLDVEINPQGNLLLTIRDLLTKQILLGRVTMVANPNPPTMMNGIPTNGASLGGLAGTKKRLGIETTEAEETEPANSPAVIDWSLLSCRYNLTGHSKKITSLAITPDGQILASGSGDKTIRLWHLATGRWWRTLTSHTATVTSLKISPDGKLLASGSQDKTVRLWYLRNGECLRIYQDYREPIFAVEFNSNGQLLLTGGWETNITIRELFGRNLPQKIPAHQGGVTAIVGSPNEESFVSCGENKIKLWSLSTRELIHTFTSDNALISCLAISPNGQLLAAGGNNLKLWHLGTGELIHTLAGSSVGVASVSFSPDGQILASGVYGKIDLWDVSSGELVRSLSGHSGEVAAVTFQGNKLVSGDGDGIIKVWSVGDSSD
ncbi:WD40 domain-containing protein [Oscillatoria salina]|uniref:WD40 domain-containing protein n=1 Tax=Oscillatoria salina TaxID=331517 RepID=UPI001CC96EF6|nr:Hsp70 family protein [Oscillatoria salina]MBZ8179201.1 Hsp70 family protein [Oscillatoria salina IIICB1]